MADTTMESISRVRTAVVWARRTGKSIRDYPKRSAMSERELFDATAFATGNYPTPARWTRRLYDLARSN
jgi:hypothetical protein